MAKFGHLSAGIGRFIVERDFFNERDRQRSAQAGSVIKI
jgi:hypothetical protein